jgi:SAM-dependent methyltransferase
MPQAHERSAVTYGDATTLSGRIGAQTNRPSGAIGWLAAGLMLAGGRRNCHHPQMAQRLHLRREDLLLDIGCGSGLFLRRYASGVAAVAGVDHSPVQVALARRILGSRIAAGSAIVVLGDAAALPWPDRTFTAVACNSLPCIVAAEDALVEMRRVLRPGGRVVVATDHYASEGAAAAEERRWGWRAWTDPQVRDMLRDAGFGGIALDHEHGATFAVATRPWTAMPEPRAAASTRATQGSTPVRRRWRRMHADATLSV